MNNDRFRPPLVGGSSLLVVFAVLCLTVFALLGLSTVQADRRLAQASLRALSEYYAADSEAERMLALLRAGVQQDGVREENGIFSYACPISDTQQLSVCVRITSASDWEVLRWQAIPLPRTAAEDTLAVWNGETNYDEKGRR